MRYQTMMALIVVCRTGVIQEQNMSALTTTEQMVGNGDKWGYVASLSQVISHRNIADRKSVV